MLLSPVHARVAQQNRMPVNGADDDEAQCQRHVDAVEVFVARTPFGRDSLMSIAVTVKLPKI